MRQRPIVKRLIAGLMVVSLMFQAALIAAQLSILIASRADAAATLPTGVICSEHGLSAIAFDEAPADKQGACAICPFCLTTGVGGLAVLLTGGFSLVPANSNDIAFHFNADCRSDEHLAQPRSRGPPAIA
jgi:hypothetical protein